ncbi:MAG TPA: sensor domain-containing diguanylate cyclase [Cellvibrionaceae bacterium]
MKNFDLTGDPQSASLLTSADEFDRSLLRAIHEASPLGILVVDDKGVIVSFNSQFVETWKIDTVFLESAMDQDRTLPEDRLMHAALSQLEDPDAFIQRVQQLYESPQEQDHCELALKGGRTLERHSVGLHSENGRYLGRVWFFRDITVRKQQEAALRDLAWRDSLTQQMNRGHFLQRAAEEFTQAREQQAPAAVLMLDLDNFKEINDQYGHAVGDAVLVIVCQRWQHLLRSVDLLGRIGGEEFAVLLPDTAQPAAIKAAGRLCAALTSEPVDAGAAQVQVSVSGGLAMIAPEDHSVEDSLRRADEALYRAKSAGRNRMEICDQNSCG